MTPVQSEILSLKKQYHFTILAHNYVSGDIQDIADFVGDSLELSRKARNSHAKNIVFCGVRFMGETAKLLSPKSRVYLPDTSAGCPMADMCNPEELRAYKRNHPEHYLVAYVNTTAATKSLVDLCVTSGNAERILKKIDRNRPILFLPDRNLGANLNLRLGMKMDLWPGCCPIHNSIKCEDLQRLKALHPDAGVMVHLECSPDVVKIADAALSTAGMLTFVEHSTAKEFIVGTEEGMLYRLRKEYPDRDFVGMSPSIQCRDMKSITLTQVLNCLRNRAGEVLLSEEDLELALKPVERMLELS